MKDENAPDKLPHFIILPSYFILSQWLGGVERLVEVGEEVALLGGADLGGGSEG